MEKVFEVMGDIGGEVEEIGDRGFDVVIDMKDIVVEQMKEIFGMFGSEFSSIIDVVEFKVFEIIDVV